MIPLFRGDTEGKYLPALYLKGSLSLVSSSPTQQHNSLAYAVVLPSFPFLTAIIIECDSSSVIGKLFLEGAGG